MRSTYFSSKEDAMIKQYCTENEYSYGEFIREAVVEKLNKLVSKEKNMDFISASELEKKRAEILQKQIQTACTKILQIFNEVENNVSFLMKREFEIYRTLCRELFDGVVEELSPHLLEKGYALMKTYAMMEGMENVLLVNWTKDGFLSSENETSV